MIAAILALLACQLAGEAVARFAGLPVPGPVIGLVLLFALLALRGRLRPAAADVEATPLGTVSGVLLTNLSLLFVPAGTGIVRHAGTIVENGTGLVVALIVSTALTLSVTALVFRAVARRTDRREGTS